MNYPALFVAACLSIADDSAPHQPTDTLVAELVTRVGGLSSPVAFERIEAIEIGGDGTFYVLDGLAHRLSAFTPEGDARWSVGREGDGPGEFTAPVGLAWSPSGSLWVIDPESQRATVYDTAGGVEDSRHLPAGFVLSPWPGRFDGEGRLHSYLAAPDGSYDLVIARYDAGLEQVEIVSPPAPPKREQFFEGRSNRGSHVRARVPFTPRFVWRIDSRGDFVSVWTAEVRFFRTGATPIPAADPFDAPVVPVTGREREAALEALARFAERGGRIEPDRIPDRKPPLRTFVLDDSDRIWALTNSGHGPGKSVWQVFDPGGRHLGTVVAPVGASTVPVPVVRAGYLIAVERDELGIETVVVSRLPDLP